MITLILLTLLVGQLVGNAASTIESGLLGQVVCYIAGCIVMALALLAAWGLSGLFVLV